MLITANTMSALHNLPPQDKLAAGVGTYNYSEHVHVCAICRKRNEIVCCYVQHLSFN